MSNSEKTLIRDAARRARRAQPDKDLLSRSITDRLMAMPEYRNARCVLWYVDVRDEVRTRQALSPALENATANQGSVAVPYCDGDDLGLFRLCGLDELSPGAFGILEPDLELRQQDTRIVDPAEIDLVAVPGVAFDTQGGRLGHGRGFYDRLLARVSNRSVIVGLAFDCQLVPQIPTADHDVSMDWLVTPERTIRCLGTTRVHDGGEDC